MFRKIQRQAAPGSPVEVPLQTQVKHQLKRYLTITLGTCISGIALNAFFLPHELLSGGVTGLGMIL